MKNLVTVLLSFLALVLMFGIAAAGSAQVASDDSLVDLLGPLVGALRTGNPGLAAALALVAIAGIAARYAGRKWAFFNGSAGRALILLVGAFGGAAAAAITGGAVWSLGLAWTALGVAVSAAGGYSLVKALLVEPFLRPLVAKAPAWMRPFLSLLLKVFDKPDPVASAVAKGDAAVKANPSPGAAGVVGTAVEVE